MKKLFCITGMDGVGKSTLINRLTTEFSSCFVSDIWDLMKSPTKSIPFKSKKDVDDFLCTLTPDSRLLFLAHALKYSIDTALSSENEIIIVNAYYYKYFASEIALGANQELAKSLQNCFSKPDVIIELVLPVKEIVKRKSSFSRYELKKLWFAP